MLNKVYAFSPSDLSKSSQSGAPVLLINMITASRTCHVWNDPAELEESDYECCAGTAHLGSCYLTEARPYLPGNGSKYCGRNGLVKFHNFCTNPDILFWLSCFRLKGKQKKTRLTKDVAKVFLVSLRRLVLSSVSTCPVHCKAPELRRQWELEEWGLDSYACWERKNLSPENLNSLFWALKRSYIYLNCLIEIRALGQSH